MPEAPDSPPDHEQAPAAPRAATILAIALAAGLFSWLAFPPVGAAPLIVVGIAGYLLLARWPGEFRAVHYWALWLAALVFWLALLEGVRRAHWSAHFGWLALSAYLALHHVLFVALTRTACHTLRVPLAIAAPLLWTGLEYARSLGPASFAAGLVGHVWYAWPEMIQAADLAGGYVVTAATVLAACALVETFDPWERRWNLLPPAAAAVGLALLVGYGFWRLQPLEPISAPPLRVALVQGSIDTAFDGDPSREYRTFRQYYVGTIEALRQRPDCQLVVWPETTCLLEAGKYLDGQGQVRYSPGFPYFILADDWTARGLPPDEAAQERQRLQQRIAELRAWLQNRLRELASVSGRPAGQGPQFLVGAPAVEFTSAGTLRRNSALLLDPAGELQARYYKVHPVMFGEYVPLGDLIPWLYSLTPIGGGLAPGDGPRAFPIGERRAAPSICFESTVPHLIRGQVSTLSDQGQTPDLLINVTNDGWFWGSAILDLHLACNVFRAVETRRPVLVAANTGLSAHIDDCGRIVQAAPRRAEAVLHCEVEPARRAAPYLVGGDWPAAVCLLACLLTFPLAWWRSRVTPPGSDAANAPAIEPDAAPRG